MSSKDTNFIILSSDCCYKQQLLAQTGFCQVHSKSALSGLWENAMLTSIHTYHRWHQYCKNIVQEIGGMKLGCVGTPRGLGWKDCTHQSGEISMCPHVYLWEVVG